MIGCASGINDAGLAIAANTVSEAGDDSQAFNLKGVPQGLALRRVLEECSTLEEAELLLRSLPRTTMENFVICDCNRGAVFEVTTKQLVVRPAIKSICACTNHFRTRDLAGNTTCPRYTLLDASRQIQRISLTDIAKKMNAVAGDTTLQTMVFEPALLKLHLAIGEPPASQFPLREIELKELFKTGQFPADRTTARRDPPPTPPRIARIEAGKYEVTFQYRPANGLRANRVYLAGNFNDWNPTATQMTGPDESGFFQTTVPLGAGQYEYKFVVDGKLWRRDLSNDVQVGPNRNSVIEVGP